MRELPADSRIDVGFQLWRVQLGYRPTDWKPMPAVGRGAEELRVHTGGEHRVIYVARLPEAVYVLHAFEKRSRKTAARDIEVARTRLERLLGGREAR